MLNKQSVSLGGGLLALFAVVAGALVITQTGTLSKGALVGNTASVTRPIIQPNILFILTDDQRYDDMQFMPKTKALIGDRGVTFTRYYTSTALCCPGRASILTGLYVRNHDVIDTQPPFGGASSFNDKSTIATWLSATGYRTSLVGKYLNGYQFMTQPYIPPGWSDWFGTLTQRYYDYDAIDNGTYVQFGSDPASYLTTVDKNRAIQFIRSTPTNQPLFLYFNPHAPHNVPKIGPNGEVLPGAPIPAPEDVGTMNNLAPYRPPSYNEADVNDKPLWVRQLPLLSQARQDLIDERYRRRAESLQSVDRAVEELINELASAGRLDNTIIIFTSDNGYVLGEHRYELKDCVYEECSHLPLLIRGPGLTPRTDDHFIQNVDLPVSIAEWAGASIPTPVDGKSIVPLLQNPTMAWRDNVLLEDYTFPYASARNYQGVRTKDYLYVKYNNGDRELYDMNADPHQLNNLINDSQYKYPQSTVIRDLKVKFESYRKKADLGLSMTTSSNSVLPGGTITYTITLKNDGPATSDSILVSDTLPGNTTFVSCSSNAYGVCAGNGNSRQISFLQMKAGVLATITLVAKVNSTVANGTTINNSAVIGPANISPFNTRDPYTANDSATAVVTVGSQTASPTNETLLNSNSLSPDSSGSITLFEPDSPAIIDGDEMSEGIPVKVKQSEMTIGSRVKATETVNVRANPSTNALILGKQYAGSSGLIFNGPTLANGYTWWQVNFDTGADGWVAGTYLIPITP